MMKLKFGDTFVVVLEPGNFTKMRIGEILEFEVAEFLGAQKLIICHCPDIERLAEELNTLEREFTLAEFAIAVEASVLWEERDRAVTR